MKYTKPATTDH